MAKFRVLCIDGGGIRGIVPAVWLSKLQESLDNKIYENFDLICGSSTGAILAAAIAVGIDPINIIEFYKEYGPKIFRKRSLHPTSAFELMFRPQYSDTPLEDALQKAFGSTTEVSAAKIPLCITSYDLENRQSYLIRSYDPSTKKINLWEACKASSSAPSYFPAHILKQGKTHRPLVDGGVVANNPSCLALAEAIKIRKKDSLESFDRNLVIVSLGTGSSTRPISAEKAVKMGPLDWAIPIVDVLFDGSSDLASYMVRQILDEDSYVRMQFELMNASDDMDDASSQNITRLMNAADGFLTDEDGSVKFEKLKKLISK